MRITKENSIALVIDIQEKLFPHIHNNAEVLTNTLKLISGLKVLEIPILITEQYTKGLGFTVNEVKEILGDAYKPFEKLTFSCCGDTAFFEALKKTNKQNIIICGIETHVCVLQTVIDLAEQGFNPIVVDDCVSSRKPIDKKIALKRMSQEGAIRTTYESILLELCVASGTDTFRQISKIIK